MVLIKTVTPFGYLCVGGTTEKEVADTITRFPSFVMQAVLGERRVRRGHAGAAAAAAPADPRHAGGRERQEAPRREDEGEGRGRLGAWVIIYWQM